MAISLDEAIAKVTARINEMDLDWPTKPKHVVIEELTRETESGWLLFYGVDEAVRVTGRDPEPQDNPPWQVNRQTGELTLMDS